MSTDEAFDVAVRAELGRQISMGGGFARVAERLGCPENTLRGWVSVPFRVKVTDLDAALAACGRESTAVVQVLGQACQAAGRPISAIHYGGGLFYGRLRDEPAEGEGGRAREDPWAGVGEGELVEIYRREVGFLDLTGDDREPVMRAPERRRLIAEIEEARRWLGETTEVPAGAGKEAS